MDQNKEIIAYKLTKEYPGSPAIGSTLTIKGVTLVDIPINGIVYTYYGVQIKNPEKFPEFWEPVYKPTELVRSWGEAFSGEGYYIADDSQIIGVGGPITGNEDKNIFKLPAQAKSALAFAQLSHIVADASGDWVADWFDANQVKHVIAVCQGGNLLIYGTCLSPTFLPMKSIEIAKACLENHRTLWEDFWMVSK